MEQGSRRCVLLVCVALCFLQVRSHGGVVRRAAAARSVFARPRRANSFFIEEVLQGDLERECYEEFCSYEEAREYFEDTPQTVSFWTIYYDGDQCQPNPCLHGGNCTDRVGGFLCSCENSYYGLTCEQDVPNRPASPDISPVTIAEIKCSVDGPTSCHQFCRVWNVQLICSCAEGFRLHTDQRTCLPVAEHPCGQWLLGNESQTTLAPPPCSEGQCPWQVSLVDSKGKELCQAVVLGSEAVLTSARCTAGSAAGLFVLQRDGSRAAVYTSVLGAYVHRSFRVGLANNDLAVLHLAMPLTFGPAFYPICLPTKDFSENVLMRPGSPGTAWLGQRGPGRRGPGAMTYVTLDDCRGLDAPHPVSNKMFCMAGPPMGGPAGGQWQGTPVASLRHRTAFLTGLLLSHSPWGGQGRGQGQGQGTGRGLVFTKLSRFLPWIASTLDRLRGLRDDVRLRVDQHPDPDPVVMPTEEQGHRNAFGDDVTPRVNTKPMPSPDKHPELETERQRPE